MTEKPKRLPPLSSFSPRTDLADECIEITFKGKKPDLDGIVCEEGEMDDIGFHILEITSDKGAVKLGKPKGKYVTLDIGELSLFTREKLERTADACAKILTELLPDNAKSCLVACLGNRKITADSQGPLCAEHIIVTRHIKDTNPHLFSQLDLFETSCITPDVLGSTGIEAAQIVGGTAKTTKPSFIIAIDSLCARRTSRVGTTIQMSNVGIAPGSGIGNHRAALNADSVGVPVISIGIPTVVDAVNVGVDILEECFSREDDGLIPRELQSTILDSLIKNSTCGYFVTPKNSDAVSAYAARLIAMVINKALNPSLDYSDMEELKP